MGSGAERSRFIAGPIKVVSLDDIKLVLLQIECRIACSDYTLTNNSDKLIKVLSELREYDLAIDLAKAAKSSIYYPVMKLMIEYYTKSKDTAGIEEEDSKQELLVRHQETADETEWWSLSLGNE